MHEAVAYLAKRVEALAKETESVLTELATQSERETKALEEMEFGRTFDDERSLLQEKVVEALQEALEGIEEAQGGVKDAERAFGRLKGIRR